MPNNREVREFKQNNYFKLFGFPGGSAGKASARNAGDLGPIPGLGRSPGEENSYPLQYSGLENSMDGVSKSWTGLSNVHFQRHWHSTSRFESLSACVM